MPSIKSAAPSRAVLTAMLCVAFMGAPAPARATDPIASAALSAAAWLTGQQQADGGFSTGFSPASDPGATADAVAALAAAGRAPASIRSAAGASALDYLAASASGGTLKTGQVAKVVVAVVASGLDPRRFGGRDLIADLRAGEDARSGVIGGSVFVHALAMIAMARAKEPLPIRATATLLSYQASSGGWSFSGKGSPDVDSTALAAIALMANGFSGTSGPAGRALGYLNSLQNLDGGFPYQSPSDYGTDSNTNSTALVALAHIASGDQPESWFRPRGYNALGHLVLAQQSNGAFPYQSAYPDQSILATSGAIPALVRQNLR